MRRSSLAHNNYHGGTGWLATRRFVAAFAGALPLLAAPAAADDGPSAARVCSAEKLESAADLADDSLGCYAKALKAGDPVDAKCLEKAKEKFAKAVAKAHDKGTCAPAAEQARIRSGVAAYVGVTARALPGGPTSKGRQCAAAKLTATADEAAAELACHAKAARTGHPLDRDCFARAHDKFVDAFARAETAGACVTKGDGVLLEAQTDAFVADIVDPGRVHVVRDQSRAVSAPIGPAGGTLNASAADGTAYRLQISAGALAGAQTISVTPVVNALSLPLTGGLIAAVNFAPEGLQFAKPATLTITAAPGATLTRVLGFTFDDAGKNFRLAKTRVNGSTLTLDIPHFSNGGAATGNVNDYANIIQPMLNMLPATLPPSQIAELVDVSTTWDHLFPGFCDSTPLCQQVLQLAQDSLTNNLNQMCTLAKTLLTDHKPFLAEQTIKPMMHLISDLALLNVDPDFACVTEVFTGVVSEVKAQALADPKESLLEFLLDLSAEASLISAPPEPALEALQKALEKVLTLGTQLCQADPVVGEEVLERRCVLSDATLVALAGAGDDGLLSQFKDALKHCGLVIEPAVVTALKAGEQQQFSAKLYGQPTTPLVWTTDPLALGTITDGKLTAGDTGVTGKVLTERSAAPLNPKCDFISFPKKIASATVTVADAAVSVAPGAVTINPGATVQFTATVTGATNTAVTWSATGGSITSAGLFTAPTAPGSYQVKAQSVANAAKSATAAVTVKTSTLAIAGLGQVIAINEVGQVIGYTAAGDELHAFLWQNGTLTALVTPAGKSSFPVAINDAGQVAGTLYPPSGPAEAVRWQNGTMTPLGTLGGSQSEAWAMNKAGQVVGEATIPANSTHHAFLWQNGTMTDLGTLAGGGGSRALAINDAGQVVGGSRHAICCGEHAVLWQNGTVTDLGTLGGSDSLARAINNAGQVIGESLLADGFSQHAFIWQNGTMTDLGTLGGNYSLATAINDAGQVGGVSTTADGDNRAFLWQNGVMTDLGTPAGYPRAYATAINDAGKVVGGAYSESGGRALLWQQGAMTDLTNLLPPGFGADGASAVLINEAGQIVAYTRTVAGIPQYFLLTQ